MPKRRSPECIQAEKIYIQSKGQIKLIDIANKLNVPEGSVRGWKARYRWDDMIAGKKNANVTLRKKRNVTIKVEENSDSEDEIQIDGADLTEKQLKFCIEYVRTHNKTQSALMAGYSKSGAHVEGSRMLRNPKIRKYIKALQDELVQDPLINEKIIIEYYAKIAFADIGDYVSFGRREQQVIGAFGPLYEGKGKKQKPVKEIVNYVDLTPSDMVDTSVIQEVSQGKDGIKIKFADKIKALEKLEKYFDLLPDMWRRKVEEEKLKIEREKLKIMQQKEGNINNKQTVEEYAQNAEEAWKKRMAEIKK